MSRYKVRNWSEYSRSLENRGSLTLWLEEDTLKKWSPPKDPHFLGAPQQYSDDAILCLMALKVAFNSAYRQLVGFARSIFSLMGLTARVPHFTTIAFRARSLGKQFDKLFKGSPTDIVIDSSGLKIYGEGEWTVRQHGKQKRRRWKKFHIGVCPKTHVVVVTKVTELETLDCEVGPELLKKAPKSVKRAIGDGAYDTKNCHKAAYEKGIKLIAPPREGAVVNNDNESWISNRNDAINQIIGLGNNKEAIKLWKKLVGYHERSLVETAFSRFKGIFGSKLFSKNIDSQEVELNLKAYAMNKMTRLGMPDGVMI